jgi:hypothetical protein
MSRPNLDRYAERELKYQFRREISKRLRKNCPQSDPMVSGVTVMLGSIIAMAVFSALFGNDDRGR